MEDETGIKSFRFTHLPLPSEEIKLLISADLSAYLKSDACGGIDSIGFRIFLGNKCLQSASVLFSVNSSDKTTQVIHCRRRLWCQYFIFSSWCNGNSTRKASVLNLCQVCGPLRSSHWPSKLRREDSVTQTLPPPVDQPPLSPPINWVLLLLLHKAWK